MAGRSWLTVGPDQASLRLKVTPKAAKDALAGIATDAAGDQHLVVRVTAPAEAGKANRAVLKLLAKQLGLPVSQLAALPADDDGIPAARTSQVLPNNMRTTMLMCRTRNGPIIQPPDLTTNASTIRWGANAAPPARLPAQSTCELCMLSGYAVSTEQMATPSSHG